ncbi:hypothetical protein [Ensifer canadensis]
MTGIDVSRILFSGLTLGLRKTWRDDVVVNHRLFVRRQLYPGSGMRSSSAFSIYVARRSRGEWLSFKVAIVY